MRRATVLALVGALAAWCAGPLAQSAPFVDPTRPPSAGPAAGGSAPGEIHLQSVLLGPRRRVAVIDGEALTVGQKFGDATVTRISLGEVKLKQGNDIRTLKLLPDVEKVQRRPGASRRRGEKEGSK